MDTYLNLTTLSSLPSAEWGLRSRNQIDLYKINVKPWQSESEVMKLKRLCPFCWAQRGPEQVSGPGSGRQYWSFLCLFCFGSWFPRTSRPGPFFKLSSPGPSGIPDTKGSGWSAVSLPPSFWGSPPTFSLHLQRVRKEVTTQALRTGGPPPTPAGEAHQQFLRSRVLFPHSIGWGPLLLLLFLQPHAFLADEVVRLEDSQDELWGARGTQG